MASIDPLIRNNVTVSGNPAAPSAMVFVCGLGTDQSCWSEVARAFEGAFRIVRFDNVGAVPSNQDVFRATQSRYLNMNGYAQDLVEICEKLSLGESTVLVGHSLGAMACLLAAISKPRLCSRIVLIGASPRYANAPDYHGGFSREDISATYEALTRDYEGWAGYVASSVLPDAHGPEIVRNFADSLLRVPKDMMLTVLCSILQADRREDMKAVTSPTLILQTRDDIFVPMAVAEYLHTQLAGSELVVIEASGHLPHLTAPAQVIAAMAPFVGSARSEAAN